MLTPECSRDVQLQFLKPTELEQRAKAFPVVYVPFGPIEWHGYHLPLGCDALKAHGILCKTAEQYGGVVYPPFFLHDGWNLDHLTPTLTDLFQRLKNTGFRVIIGVSGHNVQGMIDMINDALEPVTADDTVRGIGIWEISLSRGEECSTDHAAKWETSDMLFFYPDRVDLSALGEDAINLDMKSPSGIGGLDPREHASAEVGRRCAELASEAIGQKARELLASLPEEHQAFGKPAIEVEHWWMV
ncbi:MAG: creatininase family protein [Candidatus Poribacteria bacterium]|nr:creatininase family protein [Candidatus Poribacteria bacterium]